jgi:hypothetical protein
MQETKSTGVDLFGQFGLIHFNHENVKFKSDKRLQVRPEHKQGEIDIFPLSKYCRKVDNLLRISVFSGRCAKKGSCQIRVKSAADRPLSLQTFYIIRYALRGDQFKR